MWKSSNRVGHYKKSTMVRIKIFYKISNSTLPFGNTHLYKIIRKWQQQKVLKKLASAHPHPPTHTHTLHRPTRAVTAQTELVTLGQPHITGTGDISQLHDGSSLYLSRKD